MNERDKLQARIEQNHVDRKELESEGDRLQAKLDELGKPELRHGDYGWYEDELSPEKKSSFVIYGFDGSDVLVRFNNRAGTTRMGKVYFQQKSSTLGNIFDDLKDMSEDLEEFEVEDKGHDGMAVRYDREHIKFIASGGQRIYLSYKKAEDFHRKLGQVIATARRREGQKK